MPVLGRRTDGYNPLMKRATLGIVVVLLLIAWNRTAPRAQSAAAPSLVGTWLLTSEQMRADSDTPTAAQGARGMLILDGAGHYFEIVDQGNPFNPRLRPTRARRASGRAGIC